MAQYAVHMNMVRLSKLIGSWLLAYVTMSYSRHFDM